MRPYVDLSLPFPDNDFSPPFKALLDYHHSAFTRYLQREGGLLHGLSDDCREVLLTITEHWRDRDASPSLTVLRRETGLRARAIERHIRTLRKRCILSCYDAGYHGVVYSTGTRLDRVMVALATQLHAGAWTKPPANDRQVSSSNLRKECA